MYCCIIIDSLFLISSSGKIPEGDDLILSVYSDPSTNELRVSVASKLARNLNLRRLCPNLSVMIVHVCFVSPISEP